MLEAVRFQMAGGSSARAQQRASPHLQMAIGPFLGARFSPPPPPPGFRKSPHFPPPPLALSAMRSKMSPGKLPANGFSLSCAGGA